MKLKVFAEDAKHVTAKRLRFIYRDHIHTVYMAHGYGILRAVREAGIRVTEVEEIDVHEFANMLRELNRDD